MYCYVDNVLVTQVLDTTLTVINRVIPPVIVPPGSTYQITVASGATVIRWIEFRDAP
jgi:hypothetical protein